MAKVFSLIIFGVGVICLVGCAPSTSVIQPEYKGRTLSAGTFGVSMDPSTIGNSDDVVDDLGTGVVEDVFMNYFRPEFTKRIKEYGRIDSVVFFKQMNGLGLEPRELDINKKEKIRIFLPADSICVGSDSLDPEYVLFVSNFSIYRVGATYGNYSPGVGGLPGFYSGGSTGSLSFNLQFAIWDNRKGCLVSYGRIQEESALALYTMVKANWNSCVRDITTRIMKASPFFKSKR